MSYPHLQKRHMELWEQGTITIGRHQVAFSLISHERFCLVHLLTRISQDQNFDFLQAFGCHSITALQTTPTKYRDCKFREKC